MAEIVRDFYANGTVLSEYCTYRGLYEGPYITYHPNGKINIKSFYRRGMLQKDYLVYNEDGVLIEYGYYHNGDLVNIYYLYYPNYYKTGMFSKSNIKEIRRYRANKLHGQRILYNSDGSIYIDALYESGELVKYRVNYTDGTNEFSK